MIKSKDMNTNTVLNYIGDDVLVQIEDYINGVLKRDYKIFVEDLEIDKFFEPMYEVMFNNLSYDEESTIRYYTTRAHQSINSFLRGKWNYEVSGKLTNEDKEYYKKIADEMDNIISKSKELPSDITTYRAVGINAFRGFGIYSIDDLPNLVGQYLFESGFSSTSIKRDSTLLNTSDWYGKRNIEIEYLIPKETQDGIPLTMAGFSFYNEEAEYLINKNSLTKVLDVQVSDDKNHAYVKVVYIPIKIWDRARFDNQNISR